MGTDSSAPEGNGGIFTRRTWILIGALLASCALLTWMLQIRQIDDLDVWLFQEARERYETDLKAFLRVFTEFGSMMVWLVVVPLLWTVHRKKEAGALLVALLTVVLIAGAMKYAIDRPRPFDVIGAVDPLYRPTDPSFPSAHAMTAFAAATAIGLRWRKALVPLLLMAAAVGFSRVYIGVHFPYDVASGALIGLLIGLVADSLDLTAVIRSADVRLGRIKQRLRTMRRPHR
jgi:undecaprenyl-diphosphatase